MDCISLSNLGSNLIIPLPFAATVDALQSDATYLVMLNQAVGTGSRHTMPKNAILVNEGIPPETQSLDQKVRPILKVP